MGQRPQTSRARALIDLAKLLFGVESNWQPTVGHYLWAIRIALAATALAVVVALIGGWLWNLLADYVEPKSATQRKDLANIFVLIAAGVVATLTAIAALGNLYVSRRNLQNARETLEYQRSLEEQRGQGATLQAYLQQIGDLLLDKEIPLYATRRGDAANVLAQAQTLSALDSLDASHKRDLVLFLHNTGLIQRARPVLRLVEANLSRADLGGATLRDDTFELANLTGADLTGALSGADLSGADLSGADLSGADLSGAELSMADFPNAKVTKEQLRKAASLQGATMPNGQLYEDWYEDWLENRETRQQDE